MEINIKKRLTNLEVLASYILFFIPLILILATGEVRKSISDYANSDLPWILPSLLSISASLYIFNGVLNKKKWYNVALGLSLVGIAFTPVSVYPILHYIFTGIFFIGSALIISIFSSKKERWWKILISSSITLLIGLSFLFNLLSVFWAEWIIIAILAFHFKLESKNKTT